MLSVDLGASVEVRWPGAPQGANPSLSLVRPDGTAQAVPTVTVDPATNVYSGVFTATMAGRWQVRWISTGAVGAFTDVVDVWPADPLLIISLDTAKAALNIRSMPADDEADLRLYVAACTPVIEDIVGPVIFREFTQVADGGKPAIVLHRRATEIVWVSERGSVITDFDFDAGASILFAGAPYSPRTFRPGTRSVLVRYKAGYLVIPPNLQLATRELLRHWWQQGKQSTGGMRGGGGPEEAYTPSGFAVPRRVIELCAPHEEMGGFA